MISHLIEKINYTINLKYSKDLKIILCNVKNYKNIFLFLNIQNVLYVEFFFFYYVKYKTK